MFHTLKTLLPFDNGRYVSLLKKYKKRRPEKIWSLLDEEFDNDPVDEILNDYEDHCRGCNNFSHLDDMGYCEKCGEKFERDMLRLRRWEFSLTASYIPKDEYENLRQDTIDQFGPEFEILSEDDLKEIGILRNKPLCCAQGVIITLLLVYRPVSFSIPPKAAPPDARYLPLSRRFQ